MAFRLRSRCRGVAVWISLVVGCEDPPFSLTDREVMSDAGTASDTIDYGALDSDKDWISDLHEGRAGPIDTDGDGDPDYLDEDSENDGVPDRIEGGDESLSTSPVDTDHDGTPDFRDADSDNDGIADGDEDTNGNGEVDPGETSRVLADTDGDGASDLTESVAGTDPLDANSNPQAAGHLIFTVPFNQPPEPEDGVVRFRTSIHSVDLYFLEDISGSMSEEIGAIHDNLGQVLEDLTCEKGETAASCPKDCATTCGNDSCEAGEDPVNCPMDCLGSCGDGVCIANEVAATCPTDCPDTCGDGVCQAAESPATCSTDCAGSCGDGTCRVGEQPAITACIRELWTGAGLFGSANTAATCDPGGHFAYQHLVDLQAEPEVTEAAIPSVNLGLQCREPGLAATFFTVTGLGSEQATEAGFVVPPREVPSPEPCPDGYRGYPCFRPDSLALILLIGDEPFSECYLPDGAELGTCEAGPTPTMSPKEFPIVSAAVMDMGARIVAIQGQGGGDDLRADFEALGIQTGSVSSEGIPYVFDGADEAADEAVAHGVRELIGTLSLDMSASITDDEGDDIDAVSSFVDRIEVFAPGSDDCLAWADTADRDGDGSNETFVGVSPGMSACWKIVARSNVSVNATTGVQLYSATLRLWADSVTLLDERKAFFLIPPFIQNPVK